MSNTWIDSSESQAIRDEIAELEERLRNAEARLKGLKPSDIAASSFPTKVLQSIGNIQGCLWFVSYADMLKGRCLPRLITFSCFFQIPLSL